MRVSLSGPREGGMLVRRGVGRGWIYTSVCRKGGGENESIVDMVVFRFDE